MQEDGDRLVEIRKFEDPMQADLVRGMLEAHGIDAAVRDDRLSFSVFGGTRPGVRLSVLPEDADRARWLMMHGVYEEGEEPDGEEFEVTVDGELIGDTFPGEAAQAPADADHAAETAAEPGVCPNCGSDEIGWVEPTLLGRWLFGLTPRWMCRGCEWEWTD